jgi:hypothetical protein
MLRRRKTAAQLQGIRRFKKDRQLLDRLSEWGEAGKVGRVFRDTDYSNMYYLVPGDPTEAELAQTLVGENPEPGAYDRALQSLVAMTTSDLHSLAEQYGYEDEWKDIEAVYKKREYRKKRGSTMRRRKTAMQRLKVDTPAERQPDGSYKLYIGIDRDAVPYYIVGPVPFQVELRKTQREDNFTVAYYDVVEVGGRVQGSFYTLSTDRTDDPRIGQDFDLRGDFQLDRDFDAAEYSARVGPQRKRARTLQQGRRQGRLHPRVARRLRKDRTSKKWENLPGGWTKESLDSFWNSVGGDVSGCIEEMKKNPEITDPGAFCAALSDKVRGTKWRHEKRVRHRKPRR